MGKETRISDPLLFPISRLKKLSNVVTNKEAVPGGKESYYDADNGRGGWRGRAQRAVASS